MITVCSIKPTDIIENKRGNIDDVPGEFVSPSNENAGSEVEQREKESEGICKTRRKVNRKAFCQNSWKFTESTLIKIQIEKKQKNSNVLVNIHHSTTNTCLYSSTSSCPLLLKSLTSIHKWTKVSQHLLLRESVDKQIYESFTQLKCSFWELTEAVVDAESRLEFQNIIRYHLISRVGLQELSQV